MAPHLRRVFGKASKRLTPVCACLIFIIAPAFASHQLPDYPARAASDYSIKAAEAGAIVGIEPFDESGLQKTYFNARLTEKCILPVFVVVQNTSATDSIIFDKSAIGLADPADLFLLMHWRQHRLSKGH